MKMRIMSESFRGDKTWFVLCCPFPNYEDHWIPVSNDLLSYYDGESWTPIKFNSIIPLERAISLYKKYKDQKTPIERIEREFEL